jgi:hypothetical protein
MMKTLFLAVITFTSICQAEEPKVEEQQRYCTSTQEYVTALEFLRAEKVFAIAEPNARKVAEKIAMGCTGAAGRFIRVTKLLSTAGLGGKDAVETGLEFSSRTDTEAETFAVVFRHAFLEQYLDLDLAASVQMAKSLTTEFEGDTAKVKEDFLRLSQFCTQKDELDLPRPQCGTMAAHIASKGQGFGGGIATKYIKLFEFIRKESKGPGLTTGDALRLAEKVISQGPGADENFINGYRYATSTKGLSMGTSEAISFAQGMADQNRAPASVKTRKPKN